MRTLRKIYQSLAFSALLVASNCTSDGTEPDDDGFAAADAGNQVVDMKREEVNDSEIPNPEQVAAEAGQAAEAAGESIDNNSTGSIQDLASDQQAGHQGPQLPENGIAEDSEYQLAKNNKAAQPVVDAEAAQPRTDSLPSLSQVVAESDSGSPAAPAPSKGKKAKAQPRAEEAPASLAAESAPASMSDEPAQARKHKGKAHKSKSRATADTSDAALDVSGNVYIVQPGDTLGQISSIIFGTSRRWQDLASANGLTSDSHIYPGDVIKYPADTASAEFEQRYSSLARSKIVVQKGDTLSSIAASSLGNKAYWKLLWRWNSSIVPEPNKISEGQSLEFVAPAELAALLSDRKGLKSAH